MERLNATFRECLAPLARRGRALARHLLTWHEGMFLVGTVDNFLHAADEFVSYATDDARHGGGDHRPWLDDARTLSFHVPLPRWVPPKQRGRPARALQRLIKRWCS